MPKSINQAESITSLRILSWSPRLADKIQYLKRRYRASNYTKEPEVRKRILARDNHQCVQCGLSETLTIDHIVSVYRGGGNEDDNLQTLCNKCNAGKAL